MSLNIPPPARLNKEQEEACRHTIIKVARDEDLAEQIGKEIYFDLVNHDKVRTFRIKEQLPFTRFKEKVAKKLGIPVQFQRFWLWGKRENHTYRPCRALTAQDEIQSVGQLREKSNETKNADLKLFLEVELCLDLRPLSGGGKMIEEEILLFFKLYDPLEEKIRYVGRLFVKGSGKPLEIFSKLKEFAGFSPNEEIELFEELKFEPNVICEKVDNMLSFRDCELEDGDIICFQKSLQNQCSKQYRFPEVPSFLEYVHNHQMRLKKEQEEKEQKGKGKAEAGLYTMIKVARDEDLGEQIGNEIYFDLVDHDKVRTFYIPKQMPFIQFKEEVAKAFGIPVQFQRYWLWAKRQNHTYRPDRALTAQEEIQSVNELRVISNNGNDADLKLYLEVEFCLDLRPAPPGKSKEEILLFFKLYDPLKENIRYVGRLYVKVSGKPLEISSKLKEFAGFSPDEEIELYEEIRFEPSVMCEKLDSTLSFYDCKLEDGDIICFEKSLQNQCSEQYRFPKVPSFLEYVHNRQDYCTGATLASGKPEGGVYPWPPKSSLQDKSTSQVNTTSITTAPNWHRRLGHPSTPTLRHILKLLNISSLERNFFCNSCKCNKMHKTPFYNSSIQSSAPLEYINSDVWGAAPEISIDGFQYYLIFVDHYTKYIWLFPLKRKSDVSIVFPKFKRTVEKLFQKPIICFYSDNGREFLHLRSFFEENGISHFLTPPYTPEHNTIAERRHRHVVETEAKQESKDVQQESCPKPNVKDHAGAVVANGHEVCNTACCSEDSAFSELEQLLKQKTLSRAEIDCLTELLRSKNVDTPAGNDESVDAAPVSSSRVPPSFGPDKSKESSGDKVPTLLFSSSSPLSGSRPESSSSLSNPALGLAGASAEIFESDNSQKDGKSNGKLELLSSDLSPSTLFTAPSSTSSFSNGQFAPSPVISSTSILTSSNSQKDVQSGSSSEVAPSTSISGAVSSTTGNSIASGGGLFGFAAVSSGSAEPLIRSGSSEVQPISTMLSTTLSASNANLKTKPTDFGNLSSSSPFAGSSFASTSPGNSIFGLNSSGMSTVTTASIQSQSSVFSTGVQTLVSAQTSVSGSDNTSFSQSVPAHFGSTTPQVGNSGMPTFSSVGSASSDTGTVSAAASDSKPIGSSSATFGNFSFGANSSASSTMGSSVGPSSTTQQAFGASPAVSAATTAFATSSNATSAMFSFGVNSSSSSANATDTSTRPSPSTFNFGGSSSASSLNNFSTSNSAAPGVFSFGGGSSASSINTVSTSTTATPGIFNFGGSSSASSTNTVSNSTSATPGILSFGANTSVSSTNAVSTSTSATPGIFGFGASSSVLSTNAVSTSTSTTPSVFNFGASSSVSSANAVNASITASPSSFAFGASSASPPTSSTAGIFGSNFQAMKSPGFSSPFSSATPTPFAFGASSSSFTAPTTTTPVFRSTPSTPSGPTFPFGPTSLTNSSPQPIFGNSTSPFTASPGNNNQMNMEDSMAEDTVHASSPAVAFGQPSVSPSPGGFAFGSTPPSTFQFGGQQNQVAAQNPSPFAASGSFGAGGSFSLGSNGPDKSGRRTVKVSRNKNRKK